jgi:lytic murein transglycosylase
MHSLRPLTALLFAAAATAPLRADAQALEPFSNCVASLRQELPEKLSPETFDTLTRDVQDLRPMIDAATKSQPEFQLPIWDYIARRTDEQRVAQGRDIAKNEAAALASIQQRHGVDGATTVAVFGVETDYGRVRGTYPVIDATLSRACLNLHSSERKDHFFTALWLVQEGVVRPEEFKGSWAGAFGMTQFMPGTFAKYMSAADDKGQVDIIHSVPDALATTARYLRGLGWIEGVPWAVEVRVPPSVAQRWNATESEHGCLTQTSPVGKCRRVAEFAVDGVTRVDGQPLVRPNSLLGQQLEPSLNSALLMPAGAQGPAWLITPNYQAIWRYNRADAYALAIGLLSDAVRGSAPQRTPWPTDDAGLSRAEFKELQAMLFNLGHCDVAVDGASGPKTSAAIRDEERKLGWVETGRGGQKVFAALKKINAPEGACTVSVPASGAASAPEVAASVAASAASR